MDFQGKHFLSTRELTLDSLAAVFRVADLLAPVAQGRATTRVLEGAVLGSLFFEASTRTRLSFEAAFQRLGGAIVNTTGFTFSSIAKGESIYDTARVVAGYVDTVVMRHPEERAIHEFAAATHIPVINGGNGAGEHPTQALLDIYTIEKEFARIGRPVNGARIALVGDLKYGRTVHSLIHILSLYKGLTLSLVSPDPLRMPAELVEHARSRGHTVEEHDEVTRGVAKADLIYATRVQKERFAEGELSADFAPDFQISLGILNAHGTPHTVVMHPLPRDSRPGANDLAQDLNTDPRLAIFRQTDNGVPVRMALFALTLGVADGIEKTFQPARWWRPERIGPDDAAFYRPGKSGA